ncbi:LOW QUALITY PROTEIN: hypothetical protein PHMEG_0009934 [Phytophthora megakarya]|uniref:Uncharacterized protein n=1 Tax=Phytophthora megakarya TaxID=4795 RepID=A0A225WEY2_9STRA|nr:LOW QUALITY PROTEIN: hypothetical protein PHMEG_0009934 [Phytophthora megakarya]
MLCHTFKQLAGAFSFSDCVVSDDLWKLIRPIVLGFDSRRLDVVSPGEMLCACCMSSWQGKERKYYHDRVTPNTKQPRKVGGIDAEFKSIADRNSGTCLGLDLVEDSEDQNQKPYHAGFLCLCLCEAGSAIEIWSALFVMGMASSRLYRN